MDLLKTPKKLILLFLLPVLTLSLLLTGLMYNQIVNAFRPSLPITITATGVPGFDSEVHDSEVWILEIRVNRVVQNLSDIDLNFGWEYRDGVILSFLNQPAELGLSLPPGTVDIKFLEHPWSGIVAIDVNNNVVELDLFSHWYFTHLDFSVLNTGQPTVFGTVVRLIAAFVLIMALVTAFFLLIKYVGIFKPLIVLVVIAIIVNVIQLSDIDDPGNYGFKNSHEIQFMKALYKTQEPDIFRSAVARNEVWAKWFGVYVAIGSVGNNINLLMPADFRGGVVFNDLRMAVSNVKSIEVLNYSPSTFLDTSLHLSNDTNPVSISNEQYNFAEQFLLIFDLYSDSVKELILLTDDDVLIFLDTSLLTDEAYDRIEELRR